MYANVPSHTCSFQLPLRNGAKTQFAATSNNMSNGKIAQVFCTTLKKKEVEIIQEGVGEGTEQEARKGKRSEVKAGRGRGSVRKRTMRGFHYFTLKYCICHTSTVCWLSLFEQHLQQNAINFEVWCFPQIRIRYSLRESVGWNRDAQKHPSCFSESSQHLNQLYFGS